ncbi:MAG: protein translocase subunit SecD [Gemmataceae bacterium]|nr:protein translocase subunit SecD [Gemmataceae bacterium]
MQRNYLRGLLICLVPCLVAGYFAARLDKYRLGIDLAGGTILVYEINLERTKQRNEAAGADAPRPPAGRAAEGLSSDEMNRLAAQIKRRIDPADLKNVTVRPLGSTRVEVILPTGGSGGGRSNLTGEEIDEVKRLMSQMGVLEFRILANQADDEAGGREARDLIDRTPVEELNARAEAGLPPPAPAEQYEVTAAGEKPVKVRYAWVELSPEERKSLNLDNASADLSPLWAQLAAARNKVVTHSYPAGEGSRSGVASMYLTSREVRNKAVLEKEAPGQPGHDNPKKVEYFALTRVSPVDQVKVGGDITLTANAEQDQRMNPAIGFRFNGAGAQAFGRMTERNKPSGQTFRNLAVILDEQVISAPTLNAVLTSNGIISSPGGLQQKYVNRIVTLLRSGALSAELRERPVSQNTIGPTLGADTIRKGTLAVGLAFAAVLVFMVVYYRAAGLIACIALLANLLLTVGFMVAMNAAFTLPGLAGIVLMLGMAVDANVLIYERLREERNKGANLATAVRNGYDRAFPTIIDTHLTSIFTAIVLYTFGNDQLKGFAVSLTVGLVISLFTSLYMTRLMFDYLMHRRLLGDLRMLRLFERPNFNPMKYRGFFLTLTTALTVLGLGLFLVRGEAGLNVDFRGGTVYAGRLRDGEERAMTGADGRPGLRDLLGEAAQRDRLKVESVRLVNRPATGGDLGALGTYVFDVTYSDGTTSTVELTQKPAGDAVEAVEADVKARASHLPDVSVEQMFLSTDRDFGEGRSRYFTVRTTERQRDLVQATLDRLLRDGAGKPLMDQTAVTVGPVTGSAVELTFDRPASPSYIRDLLEREFRKESADDGASSFELTGVGEPENGRFRVMRLDVGRNAKFGALRKQAEAAAAAGPGGLALIGGTAVAAAGGPADPELAAQVKTLQAILERTERAVETRPEPERLEVFDSSLAAETRMKAFYAILWSWLAILLYLWFRFGNWTFGLAAVLCLIHDLCFTLGAIAACHYLSDNPVGRLLRLEDFKIDLAAVAALLTLVGYSVNDTIVVFDRIREVRGKNPALTPQMINDSVNQTLSRTVLASLTVFLVAGVLYWFGGEGVHLFAFVMVMGVLVGTYSSIFVAAPLLLLFGEGKRAAAEAAETPARTEEEAAAEVEG